jgi:hypothetical protein
MPGSVVSGAAVVAEPDGRVLERVHDYRVDHGLVAELEEEGRVSGDVMGRCPGSNGIVEASISAAVECQSRCEVDLDVGANVTRAPGGKWHRLGHIG